MSSSESEAEAETGTNTCTTTSNKIAACFNIYFPRTKNKTYPLTKQHKDAKYFEVLPRKHEINILSQIFDDESVLLFKNLGNNKAMQALFITKKMRKVKNFYKNIRSLIKFTSKLLEVKSGGKY